MENNQFPFDAQGNTSHNTPILVPAYENSARRSLYIAIVAFLAGVLVGFGSYRVWPGVSGEYAGIGESSDQQPVFLFDENEGITAEGEREEETAGVSASLGENIIIVTEQPAGNTVAVSLVTVEKESWVAVHEERNGKPGNILGAQLFSAGTNSGVVELLRATDTGKTYYAVLRGDDGDRQFDYTKDLPLTDSTGKEISVPFTTIAKTVNPI